MVNSFKVWRKEESKPPKKNLCIKISRTIKEENNFKNNQLLRKKLTKQEWPLKVNKCSQDNSETSWRKDQTCKAQTMRKRRRMGGGTHANRTKGCHRPTEGTTEMASTPPNVTKLTRIASGGPNHLQTGRKGKSLQPELFWGILPGWGDTA